MSVNLMLEHQVKVEQLTDELRRATASRRMSVDRNVSGAASRMARHPLLQEALRSLWVLWLHRAEIR